MDHAQHSGRLAYCSNLTWPTQAEHRCVDAFLALCTGQGAKVCCTQTRAALVQALWLQCSRAAIGNTWDFLQHGYL